MRFLKKFAAVIITMICCVTMIGVPIMAINYSVTKDDAKIFGDNSELQTAASGIGLSVADSGAITIDSSALADKSEKEQNKAMNEFVQQMTNAGISATGSNAISDALKDGYAEVDGVAIDILIIRYLFDKTQGDITGAMGIVSPFLPYINILIGVVAILIAAALVLSTVIDLAFIGLPAIREMMMSSGDTSNSNNSSGSKPKALTYACWATINDVEGSLGGGGSQSGTGGGGKGYKNAYGVYFKRRVWDYILLGVCLSFLIFGGFSRFITAILGIGKQLVN